MLGASGVQVGTAFLRCEEADVSDAHRKALAEASEASTVVSDVLSGRSSRYIRNRIVDELSGEQPLPFPAQFSWTGPLEASGDAELAPLFSGQSAALSRDLPAGDLVETLAAETERCLQSLS